MKRKRYTEEQIAYALRRAEAGTPIIDLCRELGISEQTGSSVIPLYRWRRKYASLGVSELRRLKQLEKENQASNSSWLT